MSKPRINWDILYILYLAQWLWIQFVYCYWSEYDHAKPFVCWHFCVVRDYKSHTPDQLIPIANQREKKYQSIDLLWMRNDFCRQNLLRKFFFCHPRAKETKSNSEYFGLILDSTYCPPSSCVRVRECFFCVIFISRYALALYIMRILLYTENRSYSKTTKMYQSFRRFHIFLLVLLAVGVSSECSAQKRRFLPIK